MKTLSRRRLGYFMALAPGLARADAGLAAAVGNPRRGTKNVARDKYRHPLALLAFFGIKPDLSVVEIEPGGGYWTEILAPYLYRHGTYRVAVPIGREAGLYLAKLGADPAVYDHVIVEDLASGVPLAPGGGADLVLSFRNLHDWMRDGTTSQKLSAVAAALKPGGVFGIEDHRAPADVAQDPLAKSGYVREDFAVAVIEAAGFRLVARSSIGDNPKDTKNYPKGVWTLPPVLAMGDMDRAKYLAIGESDRWTLKFAKI